MFKESTDTELNEKTIQQLNEDNEWLQVVSRAQSRSNRQTKTKGRVGRQYVSTPQQKAILNGSINNGN